MSEPMYDFRDGILLEKVVYKDDSFNCVYILYYLGCLVLTLMWGSGWFALFFYAYIFHEQVAFIVFIVVWCVFMIIVIVIGILTIQKSKAAKRRKQEQKEERERQLKEIHEAKKRRNERMRQEQNNNLDDINTNADPNQNINYYESERRPVIDTNDLINEDNNKY